MKTFVAKHSETIVYAVFFLFFLQLIADFVEGIYAFGLLGTSIPPEIASVVLLFSPLALLAWRKGMGERPFHILSILILLTRLGETMLDTRGRMLLAGVGVAAWLIWFPALLWRLSRREDAATTPLTTGLISAVALSALLRVLGHGSDLSMTGGGQLIGWLLAVATAVLLFTQSPNYSITPSPAHPTTQSSIHQSLIPSTLGLTSALILLYFAFASPNVMARWTGASYPAIVIVMALALGGLALLMATRPHWLANLSAGALGAWNGLFVLSLTTAVFVQQVRFPADPGGYPLYETPATTLPLYLALLLFPVIFVDFGLYARAVVAQRPSLPALGGAFALAGLFLLIMIFAHVFTTVYDYIPVVGPFFRDKFWLAYLVPGLGLALPLAAVKRKRIAWRISPAVAGGLGAIGLLAAAAVFVTAARPAARAGGTAVRVLTYNVQQGYSEDGSRNFAGQLDLIRSLDADIIGLQESDTNRIAGGNADLVRFFADALDMVSYYGPNTVPGTFGIALLSKYPIENPRTFFMYSEGEQTAAIEAQVAIGGQTYSIFVTHLGNGGPIIQQEAILEAAAGRESIILMGDFNFRPGGEQYALTTAVFDDAWLRKWPDGVDDQGHDPADRIDHIFISPNIQVTDVEYIFSPASDHPAETAVLTK